MKTALLVVDVQQSFQQRPYWRDDDVKPFLTHVQKLIDKAAASGIPVLQVFHVEEQDGPKGPFSSKSGYVKALSALRISPTEVFHKDVHSALYGRSANGRTLEQWLRDFRHRVTSSSPASARSSAARRPRGMRRTRDSR